jgi:hypothetical protein
MNGTYAEQWKKLRGIHSRLLLSFLIGPIGWLIIHFVFDPKDHHTGLVLIYVIVWVLFGAWTSYQFTHFSCPRCGRCWQGNLSGRSWARGMSWCCFTNVRIAVWSCPDNLD